MQAYIYCGRFSLLEPSSTRLQSFHNLDLFDTRLQSFLDSRPSRYPFAVVSPFLTLFIPVFRIISIFDSFDTRLQPFLFS